MFLAFVLVAAYMVFLLSRTPPPTHTFAPLKTRAHAYSGVNPEEYRAFVRNLDLCELYFTEPHQGAIFLYRALDHLQNLGIQNNEYDIHEEIEELVAKIGWEYEKELQRNAIAQKVRLQTRYLNERLDE